MSKHFSEAELCLSRAALDANIDNTPPEEIRKELLFTMAGMERVRACLGNKPIRIHSGYRCERLNALVGGSKTSQHMRGQAVDFTCSAFGTNKAVAARLAFNAMVLGIDQVILEKTWVHVSFSLDPRYEALTHWNGRYVPGIDPAAPALDETP